MRILSGRFKNREIKTPKGEKTRPTSAKVRGSVFDILQNQIQDTLFLDLFAGSGAMGIEALSRGAKQATFVERDRLAARCIQENLTSLDLLEESILFPTDAMTAIKHFVKNGSLFHIIYVDPPYALDIHPLLEALSPLLSPEGIVILEQRKDALIEAKNLRQIDKRHFGDTLLLFFSQK